MAVPATIGQLRINVNDMQVGDYIACRYSASSGVLGTLNELGTCTAAELPLIGSAAPNGLFYLVKAAKGLLIGDRIVQHSISWDTLNTGKVIQGLPWGNTPIPAMTSNVAPSGIASASSIYSVGYDAWQAFDKVVGGTSYWASAANVFTGWLAYDFGSPKTIYGYSITHVDLSGNFPPVDWTFEGWDGLQWVVLDTQIGFNGWSGTSMKKVFLLKEKATYSKFRLNMTKAYATGSGKNLGISEFELYDQKIGIIRSLTGGVAYADVNKNKILTQPNPSQGAWPTNNEYDSFLLKFSRDLVQSGKILEDVFHYKDVYTWVQDTPVLGSWTPNAGSVTSSVSSSRIARGFENNTSWKDVNFTTSSAIAATVGFRPVLEYQE